MNVKKYLEIKNKIDELSDVLQEIFDNYSIREIKSNDHTARIEEKSYWYSDCSAGKHPVIFIRNTYPTCRKIYDELIGKNNIESRINCKILIRHSEPHVVSIYLIMNH